MQEYPQDHWRVVFKEDLTAFRAFQKLWEAARVTLLDGQAIRVVKSPSQLAYEALTELGIRGYNGSSGKASGKEYVESNFIQGHSFMVLLFGICYHRKDIREGYAIFETEHHAREFAASRGVKIDGGLPYVRAESHKIAGRYGKLKPTWDLLEKVARVDATILLYGESGTGKEVAAEFVHEVSPRRGKPFVAINCGAIPETLMESELFGHERGAFTGANIMRQGVFEQANEGTLLLDEISEIPLHLQAKLLRVLQEGEIRRVGGSKDIQVDVRVIAATNRDLRACQFREDLYYRLNVVKVVMPPLRERTGDIPELVNIFMHKFFVRFNISRLPMISNEAMAKLLTHFWPGNARELGNVIERALALGYDKEVLDPEDFVIEEVAKPQFEPPVGRTMQEIEKGVLLSTLARLNGNRTHTSKALGITVRTVRNRLRKYREQAALSSENKTSK